MARRECSKIVLALCAVGFCVSAVAADFEVSDAWIRLLPAGAPAGGYFKLRNNSKAPVALVGASSSDYRNVMLHRTKEESGTSRMLHVESVDIPANASISFAPGGYHLMLMGATRTHAPEIEFRSPWSSPTNTRSQRSSRRAGRTHVRESRS